MFKFILIILLVSTQILYSQNIVINEVMSSNTKTIIDDFGNYSDWIELYNNSDAPLNISGFYLSDDDQNLKKWQFDEVIVEANSYLIIFASDMDTTSLFPHTNFKITSSGEKLILCDSGVNILDSIFIPSSVSDVSYGRISDAADQWIFQVPTPGIENSGEEITIQIDSVSVNLPGGFYQSSISVELSAGTSEIYYTLDGSNPNTSSPKYTSPINISQTKVLKAKSVNEDNLESPIMYQSYFINENTNLPVISLITEPGNLFDSDTGIYIHYEEEWERPAHVEFFDDEKNLGFSENVGINIYGGYTRRFAQKSFGVKFKSEYGKNKLEYDLFPGFRLKEFKSFILRNSGNDFDQTHIRDAFMQTLINDLDIDYLEYRPAVAYINGEYWGIYNIREKISEHYAAARHGVDPDNIDMMEGYSAYNDDENDPDGEYGLWVGNLEVVHGDTINYKQLIDYLNTADLTTDEAYNIIDSLIDIDECLLYYAAHVYYNSQDWPANNSKYWRDRSPKGKWRWIIYDLDFGFNLYEFNNEGNSENHVDYLFSGDPSQRPWSKPVESTFIPRKIVENPKIRNQFVNLVADLLNTNFKSDRVLSIMNNIKNYISGEIQRHRNRFGIGGDYNSHINRMISFGEARPDYLRGHIRNFFSSGSDGEIRIYSSEGGKIRVNSIDLSQDELPWRGIYFMGVPVQITAVPDEGYKFDGWSGDSNSDDQAIELYVERSSNITASFSIDTSDVEVIVINEINYNSSSEFDSGDWIEIYNKTENTIDLSNWYFSDSNDDHKFYFPEGTEIKANEYLVLVENDSSFHSKYPEVENYLGNTGFGLDGSGELIRLFNHNYHIIDSLTYDDILPWPEEADGSGATLELLNPELDNSLAENWKASNLLGTPGTINSVVTDIKNKSAEIPNDFKLEQNYPNPFNATTKIKYSIPADGYVSLKIYDILGEEVKTLFEGKRKAGNYLQTFDTNNFASGVYFYKLQSENTQIFKKLVLLK